MTTSLIPVAVPDQIALAQQLAASNLLPEQYRKQPANLIWAIQYAQALGVHPMTAITGIAVINGRPTASAQLIGGLVRRAGHKLRVETSDTRAVAIVIRADDPDFEFRAEWTIERARKAGLGDRGPWRQYPAAMLAARAITEVARMAAPESLFGIIYTAEELGADVDDEGSILDATVVAAPTTVQAEVVHPAEAIVLGGSDRYAIEDTTDGEPLAARNQITRIAILRKELGIDDEAYRKRLEGLYGVATSKALTEAQAADLIEKLSAAKQKAAQ